MDYSWPKISGPHWDPDLQLSELPKEHWLLNNVPITLRVSTLLFHLQAYGRVIRNAEYGATLFRLGTLTKIIFQLTQHWLMWVVEPWRKNWWWLFQCLYLVLYTLLWCCGTFSFTQKNVQCINCNTDCHFLWCVTLILRSNKLKTLHCWLHCCVFSIFRKTRYCWVRCFVDVYMYECVDMVVARAYVTLCLNKN
jgi:hypothetical protein